MEKITSAMLVILALGLILVSALAVFKPTSDLNQNTIVVNGNAQTQVKADEADIYIKVETLKPTAEAAREENAGISKNVVDALIAQGVAKEDIETSQYTLYPEYDWKESGRVLLGYKLTNVLKVTTKDLENVGKMVDTSVKAGANGLDNVVFKLSKEYEKQVSREAMKKASSDANEKALSLTNSLNVKLGKIKTISENSYYYQPFEYRPSAEMAKGADMVSQTTNIMPQDLTVSANVNIVYAIN